MAPQTIDSTAFADSISGMALFLDVDGCLIDLAERPEDVVVPPGLIGDLERLSARVGGALALVSGRAIADLDRLFAPLSLPAAGQHGLEWRATPAGPVERVPVDRAVLDRLASSLAGFAAAKPGLRVEPKGAAVAIHYRQAPALGPEVIAFADALLAGTPGWHALSGKMVVELKPDGVDKGAAVDRFLELSPFAGRRPLAAGDDVTDEDAFAAALRRGGIALQVGDREPTVANRRLPDPAAMRAWIARLAASR
ncbi:trehalose-phosphatase [Inquilinus sp. Marseille-Q2685]|uniref:trehalose-phosphatase n=1 Tax=Inquilinus sp. Marseille-Q2685 TaxID=2866581 RepID=UPI001CE3F4E9|nr:trehalose-phosphatase [Inquilinus sp. Marseille-Q2685]